MIVIEMMNGHTIKLELDPANAPITCANFEKLVSEGFYDGLTFHRIIRGFMIQGGDPLGNGRGGSKEHIVGEFRSNGYSNP
ncbi:MAG TPA: peptidylprolyl isomerase, partial [Erysipelotrichaceae bacterium]|nr:peptidylprolyl isomerase [Erysipelotrichaceae bacterium]